MSLKRHISGAVLLAVILPLLFLAPFHHHEKALPSDIHCDSCTQHQPHQGHLSGYSGTDDCLVCQLLSQQYSPSEGIALPFAAAACATSSGTSPEDIFSVVYNLSSSRAPPVPFCFF